MKKEVINNLSAKICESDSYRICGKQKPINPKTPPESASGIYPNFHDRMRTNLYEYN